MFQKGTRCDFTLEAQKAQSFENMPRTFLNQKLTKNRSIQRVPSLL